MTFVLDASITLAWCFSDEKTEHTEAVLDSLREQRAIVPSLWAYEVANVLAIGVRRKRASDDEVGTFRRMISELPIDLQAAPTPWSTSGEVLHSIAVAQQVSGYDAAYLALALELRIPIATLDGLGKRQGLKRAASRIGVDLFSPKRRD